MDRIGLIGIRWKQGGADELARFTIPVDERAERLPWLRERIGVRELVYLATCNRVELTFATDGGTPLEACRPRVFEALIGRSPVAGEAERHLKIWAGEGAAEHLFLVASGLDSSMVGESEIVGQMRDAVEVARRAGTTGPRTDWVFEQAWKVAKRVRSLTPLGDGKVSLAEIALERARERLAATPGAVGLVGVSDMTERCGRALADDGMPLVVFNRSTGRAEALAARIGGVGRPLAAIAEGDDPLSVLILATGAPDPVLTRSQLERLVGRSPAAAPPLLIDLANPPDADPADARAAGLERIGLDEVLEHAERSRARRLEHVASARTIIDEALADLDHKLTDAALGPLLGALQERYRETAVKGVERLVARHLPDLDDEQQEGLQRWARTLAARMAHLPTVGLRAVAHRAGFGAVEAFFAAADEELAHEVEGLADLDEKPGPSTQRLISVLDDES